MEIDQSKPKIILLFEQFEDKSMDYKFSNKLLKELTKTKFEDFQKSDLKDYFLKLSSNITFDVPLNIISNNIKAMQLILPFLPKLEIEILNSLWEILQNLINHPLFQLTIPILIRDLIHNNDTFAYHIESLINNVITRMENDAITDTELKLAYMLIKEDFFVTEEENDDKGNKKYSFNTHEVQEFYESLAQYTINILQYHNTISISNYHFVLCFKICYEMIIIKGFIFEIYQEHIADIINEIIDSVFSEKDAFSKYIEKISKLLITFIVFALEKYDIFENIIINTIHYLEMIEKSIFPLETLNILKAIEQIDYPSFKIALWKIINCFNFEKQTYEFSICYAIFIMTYGDDYHSICDYVSVETVLNNIHSSMSMILEALSNTNWKEFDENLPDIFQDYQNQFISKLQIILNEADEIDYPNIKIKKFKELFEKIPNESIYSEMLELYKEWKSSIFGECCKEIDVEEEESNE